MQKIILASQSPRRKQLLELAQINFEVFTVETDESFPEGLTFEETAIHIAKNKAIAVNNKLQDCVIIAADTVVISDKKITGKPNGREDAIYILQSLSGNTHQVITGVAIIYNDELLEFSETTSVSFNNISLEQIIYYVDKFKPFDKAGAYAIQEWIGAIGINSIKGDFYNVMGLPVNKVYKALRELGIIK